MSALSLIPEEKVKMLSNASRSTESLYSSSSSKFTSSGLYRRKAAARQASMIPASSEVRQRVLSARRLRMKTLHNQLADAQQHLAELAHENRILRTLHKRQDTALSKYESTNAELPQLLHSHAEEIRIWQTKYRNIMSQNKELAHKLKQKDSIILSLTDQNKHLMQLNKDKNLEERERLTERVKYLENRLVEKDNDMKLLARRLQLETKNFKSQIHNEHSRYRDVLSKLERTKSELANFGRPDLLEALEKFPKNAINPRSMSGTKLKPKAANNETNPDIYIPPSEPANLPIFKPIKCKADRDNKSTSPKSIIKKNERSSAPNRNNRAHFLNEIRHRDSDKKRGEDGIAEAIKKGMAALNADSSATEEDEDLKETSTESNTDGNKVNKEKERDYTEPDSEDDDELDVDNCNDTFIKENGNRSDDNDADENDDENDDEDTADVIISCDRRKQDDFEAIEKQMLKDYEEQELLLDAYCKDSSKKDNNNRPISSSTREESIKKFNLDIPKRTNIDQKKKVKLLAALKAIDETKCEEDK